MNANRQADPLYAGPRQGAAKPDENTRLRGPSSSSTPGDPLDETLSARAEKFENEKRRIIESCFAKKDADGAQIES
jgi:exocyst complex component 1